MGPWVGGMNALLRDGTIAVSLPPLLVSLSPCSSTPIEKRPGQ